MDFKIHRIEYEDQKIGLSHRAVGKEDEPVVDTKMYSTEAKGGMASLAELANLKFGKAEGEIATEPKKEKTKKAKSEPTAEETPAEPVAEAPVEQQETSIEAEPEGAATDSAEPEA